MFLTTDHRCRFVFRCWPDRRLVSQHAAGGEQSNHGCKKGLGHCISPGEIAFNISTWVGSPGDSNLIVSAESPLNLYLQQAGGKQFIKLLIKTKNARHMAGHLHKMLQHPLIRLR
jgi:hypothetical protein